VTLYLVSVRLPAVRRGAKATPCARFCGNALRLSARGLAGGRDSVFGKPFCAGGFSALELMSIKKRRNRKKSEKTQK